MAHPERRRLALWRVLEGSAPTEAETASTAAKVATLEDLNTGFDGKTVLVFLMALVQAWPNAAPALASYAEVQRQRASVVEAVRRLVGN